VNFFTNHLVRYLELLGRNLLRDAWYPTLGIATACALLDVEPSTMDCFVAGAVTLSVIVAAAMLCFGLSWVISRHDHD
jgi:hypothetical protein